MAAQGGCLWPPERLTSRSGGQPGQEETPRRLRSVAKPQAVPSALRRRFGIESSYRINEKARARTTAKSAALRLLWMGLAVLLQNLWVWLLWACVSLPRRGGRVILRRRFTFYRMLAFVRHAMERVYQVVEEVRVS